MSKPTTSSRLVPPQAGGGSGGPTQIAGRRPQICPGWMHKEEFEVAKNDPVRAFDSAQTKISELQQRVSVAKKLNAALLQDPQYQFGQAVQSFEKLQREHIQLNDQYNDLEAVNETLQEVLEVLRGDKHQLLVELNAIKREIMIQRIENQQLETKQRQILAFNESIDLKLRAQETQLASLDDEVKDTSKQLVALSSEKNALESTSQNLSLQSSSLSDLRQHLETTRVAQDRAIQAMEKEVQSKVQEVVQHDAQLWEFKREMSGRILALQKKAQESSDEMGRLQRLSQHEMATLAAQNRALNDELKSTADALFAIRKEKTDFANAAKRETSLRREEIQQCLSVIDLLERQNAGLEASIARMIEQNRLSERQIVEKDTINNKNVIEQANFLAMVHMELQSTLEDLFILKARLCHHCRSNILDEEDEAAAAALVAAQTSKKPGGDFVGGGQKGIAGGPDGSGGQSSSSSLVPPAQFDPNTGQAIMPAIADTQDRSRMEQELRRTREALEAVTRQLNDERSERDRERRQEEDIRSQEEEERAAAQAEEDAKRRRSRDDERKVASGEEAKTFTIRFPDGTRKKVDAFLSDTVGEVISRVAQKVGVRQQSAAEFFYLAHSVNENSVLGAVDRFLDKTKSLEQENIHPKCNLVLKFKHYKRHIRFADPGLQEWFFKQIHYSVIKEYYPVSEKLAVELAGLELQSMYGDASGKKRHSYFDKVGLDSYLPATVSGHEYDYWQDRLFDVHKKFKGTSASEARTRYINTFASKSPFWGLTFFDIRDRDNRPFLAGIGEDGMFVFDAKKRDLLASLPFDQLLGWERSTTGIFVKKRGSTKMTLYASSKLQSQEMVDLLNEYYMMLPQDLRDRLGIIVDNSEELRSRLPDPTTFQSPIARRKPVEYSSRLEHLKYSYIEHCMQPSQDGTTTEPNTKLTHSIDRALDDDKNLEDIDLSFCEPPVDDAQLALICELLNYTIEQVTPQDMQQWRENIDIKKFSIAHERDKQKLSEYCVTNVCNFIRKFTRLAYVNLSYVPLDNRNESDVVKALMQLPDLETLVLRGCKIGNKGFASIVEVFSVMPSKLKVLDLEHNQLTQTSVMQLCSYMENDNCVLDNLNVGFNQIEVQGLESLIATLKRTGSLSVLDFSSNPGGRGAPQKFADLVAASVGINDLNISSNGLTGESGVRIAAELKTKTQIKKINFSDNPIGPTLTRQRQAGSGEITRDYPAEFFSFLDVGVTCVLQELVMDRCDLHEDAGQALASVLQNNNKLVNLVLSNNRLASVKTGLLPTSWTDMIMNNSYLCKLQLAYNGISYLGVMKLFAAMTKNKSIQELVLDGNPLDRYPPNTAHSEVLAFLENNNSIQLLSLCDMSMKDDLLAKIGEGLRRNHSLRRLPAHNNEFTVTGITELSLHLQENTTLEYCDLSCRSVQVNDDLYLQAYRVLIERSNLETVLL